MEGGFQGSAAGCFFKALFGLLAISFLDTFLCVCLCQCYFFSFRFFFMFLFLPLVDLCHVIADSGEVGGAGDGKPSALHPPGVSEADAHHQVLPCHQRLSAHHHQGVAGGVVAAGPISGSVLDAASGHSSVVDELLVCKCQPTPTQGLCGL